MSQLKTFKIEVLVKTSKEEAWDLLFNRFGEVSVFNPLIDSSHYTKGPKCEVGTERKCQIDSKNYVHEKIAAARGTNGFDIDIIEGGLPMMGEMKAAIDLEDMNNGFTKIIMAMHFNTKPAFMALLMKGMMRKMMMKMLIGLKYHLETGVNVSKSTIDAVVKQYNSLGNYESFGVTNAA